VCSAALKGGNLPQGICILGIVAGILMALGVVAFPGIIRGIDTAEYTITVTNVIWWISSFAYLPVYPVWCILLGKMIAFK
jgi:hypothetical protein